jgi:geranylgeranyl diphosphate synthase type II
MHDDIMDAAPLRRGKKTIHEKWNDNVAILSGDTMLVKAYQLLGCLDSKRLPLALSRFNETAIQVCEGQQLDMDFENFPSVPEQDYMEMIRLKTAVLIGFSMELGAMLAGYDLVDQKKLYDLGENMGMGFQLMDDLLDVYGDQQKFGKQVGGDIVANKKTYLLISALEMANDDQRWILEEWLAKDNFDEVEKVVAIKSIYDALAINNVVKTKMDFYFKKGFAILDEIEGDQNAKNMLRDFALQLTKRDN